MIEGCLDKRNRLVTPLRSLFRMVVFNKPIESGSSIMTFAEPRSKAAKDPGYLRETIDVAYGPAASSRA
jgi:hypothetical protein